MAFHWPPSIVRSMTVPEISAAFKAFSEANGPQKAAPMTREEMLKLDQHVWLL